MTLKATIDTLDDVDAAFRDHYVERDGKFELAVEGMKTENDFERFSEAMKKRLADATAKLDSAKTNALDRDAIRGMIQESVAALQGDKDKGGEGDPAAVADLKRELAAAREKLSATEGSLQAATTEGRTYRINNDLTAAAVASGVRPEAVDNLTRIALSEFELTSDGHTVTKVESSLAGPNAAPSDWMSRAKNDPRFAYFWPPSKSGGSDPGAGGGSGGAGKDNPFSKEGWNLTAQARMVKTDLKAAEKLAEAAGTTIGGSRPNA